MKAMVLAAGFGTRLGEVGKKTPKCLMTAGGETLLAHALRLLKKNGVTSVVINTHHLADQVRRYVEGQHFGMEVHIAFEPQILGTGGGLKNVQSFFAHEKNFILYNADVYLECDLGPLLAVHEAQNALATLAVSRAESNRVLLFDRNGQLCGWENRKTGEKKVSTGGADLQQFHFCGVHVLAPGIFAYMKEERGEFSIIGSYLRAAAAGEKITAYDIGGAPWFDAGTPEKLAALDRYLRSRARS